jgi:hypothetical protein
MLIERQECSLTGTFGDRLQQIGHMIILLDTYQGPYYIQRVWCIYETYVATSTGIRTDVAIPDAVKSVFNKTLEHGGFSDIAGALTNIDAENAEASHKSDETEIKGLIRQTIGFAAVNETVKSALINWLASAFGDCLKMHSVSEVARCIFEVVVGNSGQESFSLLQWVNTCKDHPQLLHFLQLADKEPGDSFCALVSAHDDASTKTSVSMDELEKYLHRQGKVSIRDFASWLREANEANEDAAINNVRKGLEHELFAKVEDLQDQLLRANSALMELGRGDTEISRGASYPDLGLLRVCL